jgi:C_GCAxxG_C_C family probable redox protein
VNKETSQGKKRAPEEERMATTSMTEEKAVKGFKEGFDCTQLVLAYAVDRYSFGIDEKLALKIAASFGGGMWNGDTCGCVSGALMAVGLKYGHCMPNDNKTKGQLIAKTKEFEKKFVEKNGSLICKTILGLNPAVPEDMKQILEKNLFFTVCPLLVRSACEILDEVL